MFMYTCTIQKQNIFRKAIVILFQFKCGIHKSSLACFLSCPESVIFVWKVLIMQMPTLLIVFKNVYFICKL